MKRHLFRESIAGLAIAVIILTAFEVYQRTVDMRLAVGAGGLIGIAFLHTHLAQLARDQSARLSGRKA
jgi:hypothetical protein